MADPDRENNVAMILANRAYLYGLFHIAFGSEPTHETMDVLLSDVATHELEIFPTIYSADDNVHTDDQCPDLSDRSLIDSLQDVMTRIQDMRCRINENSASFYDNLLMNYTALFLVPGDSFTRPWESPYTGKEAMTFQISTLDVRTFYHEAGYKLQAEKHFPDDHIAAMMDFMSRMAQSTYDAFADERDSEAIDLIKTQCDFIDKHLLTWIDKFADAVNEKDSLGFYRAYALAMDAFVHVDRERLTDLLSEIATFSENVE